MKQKILSFVVCRGKFLALRNNSKNIKHGGDFWFTVTGSVEDRETVKDAVKREIKEETNLDVNEIFPLNWKSIYSWNNNDYEEENFIAFVNKNKVILNEEHTDYKWLNIDEFTDIIKWDWKIKWDSNKIILKKVLLYGLKRKKFFKKIKIEDFRKNPS